MSTTHSVRRWARLHTWTSLACTVFLLILCVTGLPLIFADEIADWGEGPAQRAARAPGEPLADIDAMVAVARSRHPREVVRFVFIDDAEAAVKVVMAPADSPDRSLDHRVEFDARSAVLLKDDPPAGRQPMTLMRFVQRLHADLFAGATGEWLLAGIGLLFLIAVVSGVVLYGRFMKKLDFGTVRSRSSRLKWLDLHNLLAIGTLVWALTIGATGILNELSKPLSARWRSSEMSALLRAYRDTVAPTEISAAHAAFDAVSKALPDRNVTSIIFPSSSFSNPHHYLVWTNGNTPLTVRLFTAALVDAGTGQITAVAQMPFYLQLLQVSRPLHFGDYGGLPLKVVWALLDLVTILVLGSGLYLWFARRRGNKARSLRAAQEQPVSVGDVDADLLHQPSRGQAARRATSPPGVGEG